MLGVEGAVSDAAVEAVAETGMVSITIEDGEPNAAETLRLLLESDDAFRSGTFERGLRDLLNGRISTWQLHRWVEERFFEVHASDWDGNAPVWHLSTSSGAFQVLIRADRPGFGHLHDLLHRVLKTIDRLTVALEEAGGAGDWAQVEAIETRFAKVRSFNDLISDMLQRHWQVGGELDRAAKLAVMVDLGFVPTTAATAREDRQVDMITPTASLGGDQRPMRQMSDSV